MLIILFPEGLKTLLFQYLFLRHIHLSLCKIYYFRSLPLKGGKTLYSVVIWISLYSTLNLPAFSLAHPALNWPLCFPFSLPNTSPLRTFPFIQFSFKDKSFKYTSFWSLLRYHLLRDFLSWPLCIKQFTVLSIPSPHILILFVQP